MLQPLGFILVRDRDLTLGCLIFDCPLKNSIDEVMDKSFVRFGLG